MIYLAGPMGNRVQIDNVAQRLTKAGLRIVSTWHAMEPPAEVTAAYLADAAKRNHADLATATHAAFVVHRGRPMETWVELGAAIARELRVLVLHVPDAIPLSLPASVQAVQHEPVAWRAYRDETKWIADRIQAWLRGTL